MKNILKMLDTTFKLSLEAKNLLINKLEPTSYKKEALSFSNFEISNYAYFIESGAVKNHYINSEGDKTVVWFGFEGDICILLTKYLDIEHYPASFEFLEDTAFYRIKISDLKHLYATNIEWANWGRKLAEIQLIKTYKEIDEYRLMDAKKRYLHLIQNNENIKNRVPIKDIASYLGVSPVTISRFRKNIS
jgi:CRP-like cAMP-binding protein